MTVPEDLREKIAADPYCDRLGIDLVELEAGFARTRLTITDDLVNFHGTPHGGAIYSLADAAFAAASNSHGDTAVALETNVSYLSAVEVGTTLVATAEETHLTRRTAEYDVVVRVAGDDEGDDDGTEGDATGEEEDGDTPDGDDADSGDGERIATFRGRVYRP